MTDTQVWTLLIIWAAFLAVWAGVLVCWGIWFARRWFALRRQQRALAAERKTAGSV